MPLKNRVIGRLEFEGRSLLHIGAGGEEVRREILKIGEKVLIPASSVKGAIRKLVEQVARTVSVPDLPDAFKIGEGKLECLKEQVDQAVQWVLQQKGILRLLRSLGKEDELERLQVKSEEDWERLGEKCRRGELSSEEKATLKEIAEEYATVKHPLYRLMGGQRSASRLKFLDIPLEASIQDKPGVGIDRKSGKASEHHLYFLEAVKPYRLRLWFIVDNLEPGSLEAKLLAETLGLIKSVGLSLGARKSVGMGELELRGGEFWIADLRGDDGTKLADPFTGEKLDLDSFINWLNPGT
ncbi:MAG: RAMP superfamily CRISPR-associated protein [Candidatus Hadarchaeales archaeon]